MAKHTSRLIITVIHHQYHSGNSDNNSIICSFCRP